MTVSKALSLFDEERKNSISEALKINWLSQLDMKIFCELLKPRIKGSFSGYTESTPKSTKLLAPEEYDEIYTAYLIMQSDLLMAKRQDTTALLLFLTGFIMSFRTL